MKRKSTLIVVLTLLISSFTFAKNPVINCFYQKEKFVIDGKSDDWGNMAIYDKGTAVVTNMSNDEEYLYIKIRIGSSGPIQRIFMGGMTLWFDPKGKKKCVKGLAFPLKEDFETFITAQKQLKKNNTNRERAQKLMNKRLDVFNQKYKAGLGSMSMIDEKRESYHFEASNLNKTGLSAILYLKSYDLLFYEARIPLNLIFEDKQKFLSGKKAFSYGFEFGGFEIEEMREEARKMSNQMTSSAYGNRSRQRMQSHMLDSYGIIHSLKVWYKKVYLAVQ